MNALPIADHIPYHSIIGDRGRGDNPNSRDRVERDLVRVRTNYRKEE